jgi:SRSO17 transposase
MPEPLLDWQDLQEDFESFHARFDGLFGRSQPRALCRSYLRGLMSKVGRRNCWQMAEATGELLPDAMQRLLYRTVWDADAARDLVQDFVQEQFGDPDAVVVVDETGFIKWGKRSVGVKRQYTGTAGKIENCQVGVFLSYTSSQGHAFLDRRLYLPEEWCDDRERRAKAFVPEEIEFRTKPQLAVEMLEHAWEREIPMRWVVADEVYGSADYFRAAVSAHQCQYVVTVPTCTPVWPLRPEVQAARYSSKGRLRCKAKAVVPAQTVAQVVASWSPTQWERLTVAEGEKGPITYDWARQRVIESREGLPADEVWLLARRSIKDQSDIAYYLSNAGTETTLSTLAQVAASRWSIEQCFKEAKGQAGLDEYEVRLWHSWYRHITLVMMAHAWLASVRQRCEQKKGFAR